MENQRKNYIVITADEIKEDFEKSFKSKVGFLERILNARNDKPTESQSKEENEEVYYSPDFYQEVRNYIIQQLLKKRKVIFPEDIKGFDLATFAKYISGFDSPDVENAFKQHLTYAQPSRNRLEKYLRDDPKGAPPRPKYLSQEEINRMYGAAPGERVLGLYCTDTRQIYLVNNLSSDEEEEEVYTHEVEHWKDPAAPEWIIKDRMRRKGYYLFH